MLVRESVPEREDKDPPRERRSTHWERCKRDATTALACNRPPLNANIWLKGKAKATVRRSLSVGSFVLPCFLQNREMHIPAYISDQLWRRRSAGGGLPLDRGSEPSALTHCWLTGLLSGGALWTTQTFGDCSQTAWDFWLERRQMRNNKYIQSGRAGQPSLCSWKRCGVATAAGWLHKRRHWQNSRITVSQFLLHPVQHAAGSLVGRKSSLNRAFLFSLFCPFTHFNSQKSGDFPQFLLKSPKTRQMA